MYQFLLADLPGRFVKPRNLLPTGVKIASNKHHRRLLLPSHASWSSNYRVPGIETEPSLLSNQHAVGVYPDRLVADAIIGTIITILDTTGSPLHLSFLAILTPTPNKLPTQLFQR